MSLTLREVLAEAQEIGRSFRFGTGYQQVKQGLENGTLDAEIVERLRRELMSWHNGSMQFASTILNHTTQFEATVILSYYFVSLSRLSVPDSWRQDPDTFLPSPAVEAINNLLLVLAEADPYGYVAALSVMEFVWPAAEWKRAAAQLGFSPEERQWAEGMAEILLTSEHTSVRCCEHYTLVTEADRLRILNHVYLLLETADSMYEQVVSGTSDLAAPTAG